MITKKEPMTTFLKRAEGLMNTFLETLMTDFVIIKPKKKKSLEKKIMK